MSKKFLSTTASEFENMNIRFSIPRGKRNQIHVSHIEWFFQAALYYCFYAYFYEYSVYAIFNLGSMEPLKVMDEKSYKLVLFIEDCVETIFDENL